MLANRLGSLPSCATFVSDILEDWNPGKTKFTGQMGVDEQQRCTGNLYADSNGALVSHPAPNEPCSHCGLGSAFITISQFIWSMKRE